MSPHRPQGEPRVLVTGGAGFVGARVARALDVRGARVVVADDLSAGDAGRLAGLARVPLERVDVAAPGVLADLIARHAPDVVVHLAARVGVARVLADPEGCRDEHLRAARALVEATARLEPERRPRVVAASTSEVYAASSRPLREDAPLRPSAGTGRWAYAGSKRAVEELLDAAARATPGAPAPVHVRLFNVVGPEQDADSGMVLPRFVRQALAGIPLTVHGDGTQVRTFAHVDDVAADLATVALEPRFAGGPLNLGGTARCTVLELAREVLRATGSRAGLEHVDPRERLGPEFDEVHHREPCLDAARAAGLARRPRDLRAIVQGCVAAARAAGASAAPTCGVH